MALEVYAQNKDCSTKFQYLASRFANLVHRSEGDRQQINVLLDELNALDYKSPMVDTQDVRQLFSYTAISKYMPDVTSYFIAACHNDVL
jgi:hypothetical protein